MVLAKLFSDHEILLQLLEQKYEFLYYHVDKFVILAFVSNLATWGIHAVYIAWWIYVCCVLEAVAVSYLNKNNCDKILQVKIHLFKTRRCRLPVGVCLLN